MGVDDGSPNCIPGSLPAESLLRRSAHSDVNHLCDYWEILACTKAGQLAVNHGVVARGRGAEHAAFRKACRDAATTTTAATAATAPALTAPAAAGSRRSNRHFGRACD